MNDKKVCVIMGSDSDLSVVRGAFEVLKDFGVSYEARIISAHRTPDAAINFARNAKKDGFGVVIAAAGKAAHLAGAVAANTVLPVIGVPIKSSAFLGLDSLLSTVQMPKGVPVATVAVDGAENAALLAVQILAVGDPSLSDKLEAYKKAMEAEIIKKDSELANRIKELLI